MCHQSWHTDWTLQIIIVTVHPLTITTIHQLLPGSFSGRGLYIQPQTGSYRSTNLQTSSDITALCRSVWQDWMRKDLFTSPMVDIHSERHPSMPNCSQFLFLTHLCELYARSLVTCSGPCNCASYFTSHNCCVEGGNRTVNICKRVISI